MSHSFTNFNTQNYDQNYCSNSNNSSDNSNRYFDSADNQNRIFETGYQQNVGKFNELSQPAPNQYGNYYPTPPQFSVPPPLQMMPPTGQMGFHPNYRAPIVEHCAQQYQPHFQFQNVMPPLPPPIPSRLNEPNLLNIYPQNENNTLYGTSTIVQNVNNNYSSEENHGKNWIIDWLRSIGKLKTTCETTNRDNVSSSLKIYQIHNKIVDITKLFNKLENLSKSLSITYKSLNEEEWKLRCWEIEEMKKQLSSLLVPLSNDKELLLKLKWRIKQRKKKRERQKRRRDEYKKLKAESNLKRQQLHQSIDQWLVDMQDTVERGRREEELRREADSVLAEVTRKKTEAKRQISLLSALLKLRQARVTAHSAAGRNVSQQQTEAFNNIIEHLKSLWTDRLNGYLLEEQGLKVMLNEAAAEEKNSEVLRKKEILLEWENTLFSCKNKNSEHQPRDVNSLISVRKQWDQFVVDEGAIMFSCIPSGWVVPVKASDSNWEKYNNSNYKLFF